MNIAAIPANRPEIANAVAITRLALIPISLTISKSSEAALIAIPKRLFLRNNTNNKIAIKVARVSKICKEDICIEPSLIGQSRKYIDVTAIGLGETSKRKRF